MTVREYELDEIIDPLGNTFSLNNGRTRSVLSEAGGGLPPVDYLTSAGPLQDGETLRGFRLRPRSYTLLVRWQACTRDQYWQYRARLLDYIRPNRQTIGQLEPLTLRKHLVINGAAARRDLYVMPAQGPDYAGSEQSRWDEHAFTETVRFTAFDPTWYDPAEVVASVFPESSDNLIFPFTMPFVFGSGVISDSYSVTYAGNWPAYPTITIVGPVGGPQLLNVTTGELIALDYTIAAGEQVTINLDYGVKSVTNNLGDNLIGYLTTDSDLATWHLEPDPGAADGINTINLAGSGATSGTSFVVRYYNRYIGI